jgi:sialic acid synthase SpsE
MRIGTRDIGPAHPPYIIAELGVNHDGDDDTALHLVDHAAAAGADAVKLQLFEPSLLLSSVARLAGYQKRTGEMSPFEMLERLKLGAERMAPLIERAHDCNMHAIVTVFSVDHVDDAAGLPFDAFKTASPDVINKPLLDALGATRRPLIVSTGAAEAHEVAAAVDWLEPHHDRLALLHCVSCYPTPTEWASLGAIVALRRLFHGPIGYSDHTCDLDTGELAVRLHASILEKHLTHDRRAKGPDHLTSLTPDEFAEYVALARRAWDDRAHRLGPCSDFECDHRIGSLEKRVLPIEQDVRVASRQSVTTTRVLEAGDVITPADLTIKRPGTGIEPSRLQRVIGRTVSRHVDADAPLAWDDLAGAEGHGTSSAA